MQYEMCTDGAGQPEESLEVASLTARIGFLMTHADDIIDSREVPARRKVAFLGELYSDLLKGSVHCSCYADEGLCLWLAQSVYRDCLVRDSDCRAAGVLSECLAWLEQQRVERDPERLLVVEQGAGASACEIIPVLSEIVTGSSFGQVRRSTRCLGSSFQILDDWSDVDEDLRDGIHTYATCRIEREGGSMVVRESIRRRYFEIADGLIDLGEATLCTESQRNTYRLLTGMLNARYR
jgi:hypothetical protein